MGRGYRSAAICRRGHIVSPNLEDRRVLTRGAEVPPFCSKCGGAVLTTCEACGGEIPGVSIGVITVTYTAPLFCLECSAPFPWLDRAGRIYLLENLLDQEDLDHATKLEVREQLAALASPEVDEGEQVERWSKVRRLAPGLWQSGQRILVDIVTAEAKKQLGLPPT